MCEGGGRGLVYLYPTLVNKPHHIATLPLKAISPSSFVLSLHVSFRNDTFWVGTIHGTTHQKWKIGLFIGVRLLLVVA